MHLLSVELQKDISTGERPEKNNQGDPKLGEDVDVRIAVLV